MLANEIRKFFRGEVADDAATLARYSRDASLFEVKPALVVFPKDVEDVRRLVRFVREQREAGEDVSLTARAAGTDMTGGPLSESIVMDFTRHMNRIKEVGDLPAGSGAEAGGYAVAEPGVYYRDFERATLAKGYLMPSYPASRELCAIGGMVANNAGGEKTLRYGKTQDYVASLKVVLSDGEGHIVKPLTKRELEAKLELAGPEGDLYRKLYRLLEANYDVVQKARPKVSKNSAGYNLWDVWDRKRFDLTKLFVGSQGTLGIVTEVRFRLIKPQPYVGMVVLFLDDLAPLAGLVNAVLPFRPSSFESFDDHTFRLALKFFWGFLTLFARNPISLLAAFLPEFWLVLTHGMPKLVLMVEFEEASQAAVAEKIRSLREALKPFGVRTKVARSRSGAKKYWLIRRESFNLLRHRVRDLQTAPFADDVVVNPAELPTFLPKLYEILDRYHLLYTIAGHVGDGNFHIIPLMKLSDPTERAKIRPAMDEIYQLVLAHGGSITGEHNDGLVRGPYLEIMFGVEVYRLFEQVKHILDPGNIFNPGKKVGATFAFMEQHFKRS